MKKLFLAFPVATLVLASLVVAVTISAVAVTTPTSILIGDVNGDGSVDNLDAAQILKYDVDLPTNELVGKEFSSVSITNQYVDENLHFWVEMSDGTKTDLGYVGVEVAAPDEHTVTFKDYDGTVLKTETGIKSGNSASAPEAPERVGYSFTGWDNTFDAVTSDLIVTATYERESFTERNVLFFDYYNNGDTTTAKLSVCGDVNLYGLEMKISAETVGMDYASIEAVAAGLMANYKDGYIIVSFVNTTGRNLTEETELLNICFNNSADTRNVNISLSDVDIFDESYNDESYTVIGDTYSK